MTIDLYPPIIHAGDLTPDAAGSKVDSICEQIHKACKGFGTDEKYVFCLFGILESLFYLAYVPRTLGNCFQFCTYLLLFSIFHHLIHS
jgi:hypothetical protein